MTADELTEAGRGLANAARTNASAVAEAVETVKRIRQLCDRLDAEMVALGYDSNAYAAILANAQRNRSDAPASEPLPEGHWREAARLQVEVLRRLGRPVDKRLIALAELEDPS